jgi:hypothetical protein
LDTRYGADSAGDMAIDTTGPALLTTTTLVASRGVDDVATVADTLITYPSPVTSVDTSAAI